MTLTVSSTCTLAAFYFAVFHAKQRTLVLRSLPASPFFRTSHLSSVVPDWEGAFLGYPQHMCMCDEPESGAMGEENTPASA